MTGATKRRVLFLCTHNSARSQMAEGFLRHLGDDRFEVASAGTEPTSVRPEAVEVMGRRGVDISQLASKTLDTFRDHPWEYVITVCDQAHESCPIFPKATHRLHWSFADPGRVEGSRAERLAAFEDTATAIEAQIRAWLRQDRDPG